MQDTNFTEPERLTSEVIVEDCEKSLVAIGKGSKLRCHYLHFVVMNNVFRAFGVHYELESRFLHIQEALLDVLRKVEARKNRMFFTSDKIILQEALTAFREIMVSVTDDQLREMLLFVDDNRSQAKWVITKSKSAKSETKQALAA